MNTKNYCNGSVAFVDMDKLLDDKKSYESLKRKRNKANAKGRTRRVQTIIIRHDGKVSTKQIIHYKFS